MGGGLTEGRQGARRAVVTGAWPRRRERIVRGNGAGAIESRVRAPPSVRPDRASRSRTSRRLLREPSASAAEPAHMIWPLGGIGVAICAAVALRFRRTLA